MTPEICHPFSSTCAIRPTRLRRTSRRLLSLSAADRWLATLGPAREIGAAGQVHNADYPTGEAGQLPCMEFGVACPREESQHPRAHTPEPFIQKTLFDQVNRRGLPNEPVNHKRVSAWPGPASPLPERGRDSLRVRGGRVVLLTIHAVPVLLSNALSKQDRPNDCRRLEHPHRREAE